MLLDIQLTLVFIPFEHLANIYILCRKSIVASYARVYGPVADLSGWALSLQEVSISIWVGQDGANLSRFHQHLVFSGLALRSLNRST